MPLSGTDSRTNESLGLGRNNNNVIKSKAMRCILPHGTRVSQYLRRETGAKSSESKSKLSLFVPVVSLYDCRYPSPTRKSVTGVPQFSSQTVQ
eukprot:851525-Rhodomonas_salina.6